MNPTTKYYLDRLARSAIVIGPFIGLMNLIQDYRRSNYRDAIVVVCLYFVVFPILSIWWSRTNAK
jgi:hypothetical protein